MSITNRILNLGIVGAGNHMQSVLLPTLRCIPRIKLKIIASKSQATSSECKKNWDIETATNSLQEVYCSNIDAIVCSGPPELHLEVLKDVLKNNIPVFVEKPVVYNKIQINSLSGLDNKNLVRIGYNMRFSPTINFYRELMASNKLDNIQINYHTNKPRSCLWGLESLLESFMLAIAVHPLNLAHYIMGSIIKYEIQDLQNTDSNISLKIKLTHASGQFSTVLISNMRPAFSFSLKSEFTDGTSLNLTDLFRINKISDDGTLEDLYVSNQLKALNYSSGYYQQLSSFLDDVRNTSLNSNDIDDSVWMYELIDDLMNKEIR